MCCKLQAKAEKGTVDVGIASKTGASDGGPRLGSPTDARDMPCKFSMRVLLASCVVQMWMWMEPWRSSLSCVSDFLDDVRLINEFL